MIRATLLLTALLLVASAAYADEPQPDAHLFDDLNGDGESDVSSRSVSGDGQESPTQENVDTEQPVDDPTTDTERQE